MKNYRITVNGHAYDVTVEEVGAGSAAPVNTAPAKTVTPAPAAAPAPAPAKPAGAGKIKVIANVPGKVVKVVAAEGTAVKEGDQVVILESMKMEIPVNSPKDGVVASIDAGVGSEVQTGDLIATLN